MQLFLLSHFWTSVWCFGSLPICVINTCVHSMIFSFGFIFFTYNCYFGLCLPFGDLLVLVCAVSRIKILIEAERICSVRWVKEDLFSNVLCQMYNFCSFSISQNSFKLRMKVCDTAFHPLSRDKWCPEILNLVVDKNISENITMFSNKNIKHIIYNTIF